MEGEDLTFFNQIDDENDWLLSMFEDDNVNSTVASEQFALRPLSPMKISLEGIESFSEISDSDCFSIGDEFPTALQMPPTETIKNLFSKPLSKISKDGGGKKNTASTHSRKATVRKNGRSPAAATASAIGSFYDNSSISNTANANANANANTGAGGAGGGFYKQEPITVIPTYGKRMKVEPSSTTSAATAALAAASRKALSTIKGNVSPPPPFAVIPSSITTAAPPTATNESFTVPMIPSSITASQLAAVAGGSTVDFQFPAVDVFPAVIGGPWNIDNDGMSDEEDEDDADLTLNGSKKKRRRQRPPNPDAELIAAATEENLKQLNIDPESKEGKRQRKRIRNRMSAQMHRERKKAYITYLENIVRHRENWINDLQNKVTFLTKENESLHNAATGADLSSLSKLNLPIDIPFIRHVGSASSTSDPSWTEGDISDIDNVTVASDNDTDDAAVTVSPVSHSRAFGSGFSLLSVVLMVGFTFFGSNKGRNVLNSNSFSISNPMNSLVVAEQEDSSSYMTQQVPMAMLQLPPPLQQKKSGRVLLSTSSRSEDEEEEESAFANPLVPYSDSADNTISIFPRKMDDAKSVVSTSHALWKYQDRVVQLFPNSPIAEKWKETKKKQRHLRTRSQNDEYFGGIAYERSKSLVPAYYSPQFDNTIPTTSQNALSMSRVLVSNGKAILDPTLVNPVASSSSSSSSVVSTWRGPSASHTSDSRSSGQGGTAAAAQPVVSLGVGMNGGDNILMMLLPASQVRWGKTWEDSPEGAGMEAMLNGLNVTAAEWHAHNNANGNDNANEGIGAGTVGGNSTLSSMWVEIGCSIFKAQIVRNVTLL